MSQQQTYPTRQSKPIHYMVVLAVVFTVGMAVWLFAGTSGAHGALTDCRAANQFTQGLVTQPCGDGKFHQLGLVVGLWVGGTVILAIVLLMMWQQEQNAK